MDFCKVTQTNGALLWYRTTISLSSLWSTEIKSQGSLWTCGTFSSVLVFTKGCCKNKWPCQKSNVKPLLGVYYENTEYKVHLAFQNQINLGAFFSKVAGKVSFLPRRVIFFSGTRDYIIYVIRVTTYITAVITAFKGRPREGHI